ncbi:uncharacterized protein LOC141881035 isoform X3 [Acropora palmata]
MDIIQIKVYVLERRPSSGHSYSGSCFSEGDVKISELNLPYGIGVKCSLESEEYTSLHRTVLEIVEVSLQVLLWKCNYCFINLHV